LTTPDPGRCIARSIAGRRRRHSLAIEASSRASINIGSRLAHRGGRLHQYPRFISTIRHSRLTYAKLRLFEALLAPGGAAIVDADHDHAGAVRPGHDAAAFADPQCRRTERFRLVAIGQRRLLATACGSGTRPGNFQGGGLVGEFQIENALVAAGLASRPAAMRSGIPALEHLKGPRAGSKRRRERGAQIFVDYAHKPDGRQGGSMPAALFDRRLVVVFAGGRCDRGKRAADGRCRSQKADRVIVTDDNPRSEDAPRSAQRSLPPRAARRNRRSARGDPPGRSPICVPRVLADPGKGMNRQIIGDQSCRSATTRAVATRSRNWRHEHARLWTVEAMASAMATERQGRCRNRYREFQSTAHRRAGRGLFRHSRRSPRGHQFVPAALAQSPLAVVAADGGAGWRRTRRFWVCRMYSRVCQPAGQRDAQQSKVSASPVRRQTSTKESAALTIEGTARRMLIASKQTTGACRCRWLAVRQARATHIRMG